MKEKDLQLITSSRNFKILVIETYISKFSDTKPGTIKTKTARIRNVFEFMVLGTKKYWTCKNNYETKQNVEILRH
jgi:hypothetical protein